MRLTAAPGDIEIRVLVKPTDGNLELIVAGGRIEIGGLRACTVPAAAGMAVEETDLAMNVIEQVFP